MVDRPLPLGAPSPAGRGPVTLTRLAGGLAQVAGEGRPCWRSLTMLALTRVTGGRSPLFRTATGKPRRRAERPGGGARPGSNELHSGPCTEAQEPVWHLLPGCARLLPPFGGGLPLEVLMFREGETGSLEQPAGYVGRVANHSMVPWQVHGGTMVLPGSQRGCQVPFSVLRMLIQATPNRRQKTEGPTFCPAQLATCHQPVLRIPW